MGKLLQMNEYGEALGGLSAYGYESSELPEEYRSRLKRIMLRAVEQELTSRQQQVVRLYYFDNYNMCEIAALLGVNKSTVSRIIKCAKKRLALCMKYLL